MDFEDIRIFLDMHYIDEDEQTYSSNTEIFEKYGSSIVEDDEGAFQTLVYGNSVEALDREDVHMSFTAINDFPGVDTDYFLDVIYPTFVGKFRQDYEDKVDALIYREPRNDRSERFDL